MIVKERHETIMGFKLVMSGKGGNVCIIRHNARVTNWGLCQGPISHNNEQTQSVEGII